MAEVLARAGLQEVGKPGQADVIIVNTCGFIAPAREESLAVLCRVGKKKKPGQLLIAAGCLSQLEGDKLAQQVPGIDGILGTRWWVDILKVIQKLQKEPHLPLYHLPETPAVDKEENGIARVVVQGGSAHLKIGDGCDRLCAFCSIPLIKGPAISRPIKAVLKDAYQLQEKGVKEIILISQDTTSYGRDLGMKDGLSSLLLELIHTVPNVPWIRLLYTFPGAISNRLIQIMSDQPKILPYLDLPLQHADERLLKSMHRPSDMQWVRNTISRMRALMPYLALRTTFIVGFPGEREVEFQHLLDFVQEIRFDRVGIFPYFCEKGTPAESLGDPIPPELKEERINRLAELQEKISLEKNQSFVGNILDVLIEGLDSNILVGRSYRDAPEIDGLVILEGQAKVGEMVKARITGALVHDLTGIVIN
jgi:ribosomal protein S12 methylthiotransferase